LINNAGFGEYWAFAESDPQRNTDMINVNIVALTNLTRYYVEDMKKHNFWKILNVWSTAWFQPGPYMAVYFATKAYVQNFSLALVNELEKTNVTVTTLCPWPTESQFVQKSHAWWAQLFAGKLPSSHDVAIFWYKSMMKWKKLVVHGFMNALKAYSIKYLPISIVLKMMNYIMKK
jgi:short-subunit dehydrogenase